MKMTKGTRRKLFWIVFGAISIGLKMILSNYPMVVESYYSRSFFIGIRWFFDALFGWLPFPWIHVFIPTVLIVLIIKIFRLIMDADNWKQKLGRLALGGTAFVMGMIGVFLWIWGFNYSRVPVEDQLRLNPKPLSLSEIKKELDLETKKNYRPKSSNR